MPLGVPSYLDGDQVRSNLPAIICGPMLRRLTRHQVSVFAAFCVGAPVTLHVRQAGATTSQRSVTVPPHRIGRHLWVAMFTIDGLDGPGNDEFIAGQDYEYWLEAAPQDWPGARQPVWSDFAILNPATGTPYQFPTFLGLPDDLADFTFFHASCRRLAGGRRDGFGQGARWLADTAVPHPHAMFLLGDQVYADEIAGSFMAVLRQVAHDLVDLDEFSSGKVFHPTPEEIVANIAHVMPDGGTPKLGGRQEPNKATLKMSSSAAKDHLWALEEFYAMYLLAWSDALWPAQLPDFDPGAGSEIHLGLHGGNTVKHEEAWDDERHNVSNAQAALPGVRRLLANVPTLMMLDDHEVTDHWKLDLKWLRDVHGVAGGKRVMINGLIAYLLFQHWGNDPARFAAPASGELPTPEHKALLAAAYVDQDQHPVANAEPDDLHELVGVPVSIPNDEDFDAANGYHMRDLTKFRNREVVRYDFRLGPAEGYPAHLVFLDERTARFVPSKGRKVRAARSGQTELDAMWPAPGQGVDLNRPTILIAPAPVLALDIIEDVLQPLIAFIVEEGDRDRDFENWNGHMPSYQHLLQRIGEYRRVIICSGDWHFAQVKEMTYANPADSAPPARAVQLQPCAAKFAFSLSIMLHVVGEMMTQLNMLTSRTFYGYDSGPEGGLALADIARLKHAPAEHPVLPYEDLADVALGRVLRQGLEAPAVISKEVADAYGLGAPNWKYTVAHVTDEGSPIPVELAPALAQAAGTAPWTGWAATSR